MTNETKILTITGRIADPVAPKFLCVKVHVRWARHLVGHATFTVAVVLTAGGMRGVYCPAAPVPAPQAPVPFCKTRK